MNKFFKLVYVNLLNLFDFNKIIIARKEGTKSNLEKRLVLVFIIGLFYVYVLYNIFTSVNFNNKTLILSFSYIVSSLYCLFTNVSLVESLVLKNKDNDMLFSYPVTIKQILFSKLFTIYLKNLVVVMLIMITALLSYVHLLGSISDTFGLMYLLSSLLIPFIPMVISTIISYVNNYFKVKMDNNRIYKFVKLIIMFLFILILFLLFNDLKIVTVEQGLRGIMNKVRYIYPVIILFDLMIIKESILCFLLLIFISILFIYLYTLFISNNYLRICSILKGVRKKNKFEYKKSINCHKIFGMVRKEILYLFSNKNYYFSSFGLISIISILLLILLPFIDVDFIMNVDGIERLLGFFVPILLAVFVTLGCTTISAMSLEKDSMQMLMCMPISIFKILLSKMLVNLLVSLIFIILNAFTVGYYLKLNLFTNVFNIIIPLLAVIFVSLTSLLLDFRFIEKKENNDNAIISQRLICIIPMFLSLVIGFSSLLFPAFKNYNMVLGTYILIFILLIIIEIVYLILEKKKLIKGLFN